MIFSTPQLKLLISGVIKDGGVPSEEVCEDIIEILDGAIQRINHPETADIPLAQIRTMLEKCMSIRERLPKQMWEDILRLVDYADKSGKC